jgi:hypothetical protein
VGRNTGKSTFLNLLKTIFGKNMTFNTNEDFRSQFNADWTGKLLIGIEEVLFDRQQDSERIKNRWSLQPAASTLTYTTYIPAYNSLNLIKYKDEKKTGRFFTVTREFSDTCFLMK